MNLPATLRRLPLLVERLLAASFVVLLVRVLYFVLGNSAIEWPFEYREFAPVSFTGALLDGVDPYALENVPHFTNVYGPLYNLLVWPFAALVGNGFQVHRLVSLFFIGAGSVLLYFGIRRGRGGDALALSAGVVLFLAQTDDVAGLARPDALGLFLFLAALAVLVRSPSAGQLTLAASALLVVLAFFTKPYFALAAPIGAAFLLLRRRPAALLRYAAWGLGWYALLAFATYPLWPISFIESVVLMASSRDDYHSWTHLLEQAGVFSRGNIGLLLAVSVAASGWLVARGGAGRGEETDPSAADVRAMGLVGLVAGIAALGLLLGTHTANGQLYYTQLILPFLLLLVPPTARASRAARLLAVFAFVHAFVIRHDFSAVKIGGAEWLAACPPCAALRMTSPYQYGSPVFDVGEENRRTSEQVRALIDSASGEVFGGPESSALLQELQGRYYDNGLSEFCVFGIRGEWALLRAYGERCRSHWEGIGRRLRAGDFARALLTRDSQYLPWLRGRYRMTARYPIRLGYTKTELGVFEPISR
jgi:hypothetical protein